MSELPINKIIHGDCLHVLKSIDDESIDCIITSPPYDDLRIYGGHLWDFPNTAKQLFRVLKNGGVMVWIVGDRTENGDESGTSFRQALYFKDIGFKLHDTMIYQKLNLSFPQRGRYLQSFEYMFVLKKSPQQHTFNAISDKKNKLHEMWGRNSKRNKDNLDIRNYKPKRREYSIRTNVWGYLTGYIHTTKDKIAFEHPAIFPEQLAEDHIKTWSNENDIILDPFMGSGTVAKMALKHNRRFIGIEINKKYIELAYKRIDPYLKQGKLFR